MIYKFYLIDKCRIVCKKTKMCAFNITFLHKFLYIITIKSMKSLFLQKYLRRKSILFSSNFSQISEKLLALKQKSTLGCINTQKFIFFENTNFIRVNSPKRVCLTENYQLLLITMHRNYFKYTDLLHTMNVYNIPGKKYQVVDFCNSWWNFSFWNTVLKIIRICPPNITKLQKTKDDKIFMIYNFFYFKSTINLNGNCRLIFRKMKMCLLNITFLNMFLYRITIRSITKA